MLGVKILAPALKNKFYRLFFMRSMQFIFQINQKFDTLFKLMFFEKATQI